MSVIIAKSISCVPPTTSNNLVLYSEKINTPTSPVAYADNSIALGSGSQTAITANGSLAIGNQALARIPGGIVQACGGLTSAGDAQVGRYILKGITTDNIETELFVDGVGGTQQLILPDNSTWAFTAKVTAHRTDATDGHAGFVVEGVVYRNSGASTTSIAGKINKTTITRVNRSWNINAAVNDVTGALVFTCNGQVKKTIRWVVLIETVEITN